MRTHCLISYRSTESRTSECRCRTMRTVMLTALILMLIFPTAEMTGVRLVDGDGRCSGRLEVLYKGEWRRVGSNFFDFSTAVVLCRELDCGNAISATTGREEENEENEGIRKVEVAFYCKGNESSVSQCKTIYHTDSTFLNISTAVFCSDSVRLVDGAGLCSGRVEVKSHQSWTTVCETDFDWQDAEVVCRELDCGAPLNLQGALFGNGKHPFDTKEFRCKGTENHLLNCSTSVRVEQTCTHSSAVGLSCTGPDDVRLVDGSSHCTGALEMFHSGAWKRVAAIQWSMRQAAMVCRQLGCGSAVAAIEGVSVGDETEGLIRMSCKGSESVLRECSILSHAEIKLVVGVKCSDSVRLVDGAGFCSGRVEMKPHRSWTTVCETDFDWQDAEVVCRELGCRAPLTLQGELFGKGKQPFSTKEFRCKGTENRLLNCSTSIRGEQTCSHGSAVGLTCSEPDDVRLVDGSSCCDGTVEMFHGGQWRRTVGNIWTITQAAVVCRQLGCGSVVAATDTESEKQGTGDPVKTLLLSCNGSEPALRECFFVYWEDTNFGTVTCSDSVRLVDGAGLCSGRVEVKPHRSWTTVCEADFDWQDAEVVCRELDCGSPLNLQGALFGEGKQPFSGKEFQCKGTENRLLNCSTSAREEQTCSHGSAVGLTCSGSNYLRLVKGCSGCAGIVELFHRGEWRKVKEDKWTMTEAAVVCRQLKCGSAVAAIQREIDQNKTELGVSAHCYEVVSEMRECVMGRNILPASFIAGVICSGLLVQPTISFSTPIRPSRGLQGPEVFRGHSFTIICSTQPQYPGGTFHLTLPWTNQSITQPAVNHSASFLFPDAEDYHQGNYRCVYENQVIFEDVMFKVEGQDLFHSWSSWPLIHNFFSGNNSLSLIITDSPLPATITRFVLVPFLMLGVCLFICLISRKYRHFFIGNPSGQNAVVEVAAVKGETAKLVSLQPSPVQQNVERGAVQ